MPTIQYAALNNSEGRRSSAVADDQRMREATALLETVPAGSAHVRFRDDGKPYLVRGKHVPANVKTYRSTWGREEVAAWKASGSRARSSWSSTSSTVAAAEPLDPVGLVLVAGAGSTPGNTSGGRRADYEYFAPGALDRSIAEIQAGKRSFVLRSCHGHGGAVIASTKDQSLSIDNTGTMPVAVWQPDATNMMHRAIAARAAVGSMRCSIEFRILRDDVSMNVRRVDQADLYSVCLIKSDEAPAYPGCLVRSLDSRDLKRSIFALRGAASLRAKGEDV
jgi:phage head maturation protease